MWDLPGSGIEPVTPPLAGGFFFFFFTPKPSGKAEKYIYIKHVLYMPGLVLGT